jgi:diguanylate cyclase (GGDEF)-like protein
MKRVRGMTRAAAMTTTTTSPTPTETTARPAAASAFGEIVSLPQPSTSPWVRARVVLTVLIAVAGLAWILRLLVSSDAAGAGWTIQFMLAFGAILAAGWDALYRYRFWTLPMQQLAMLTRQVIEGEAPIESLNGVRGGVDPIVPLVQSLLRELRQQEVVIAELNFEMQQKVANRTDALERVIGSLRQQATRDVLTGLFNRRFLDQYLPQAFARAKQVRADLCLLMVDVDNFKLLNDTLGHAAGDDLLRAIGQLIRSAVRGEDVAFRCGGDEFVLLLPGYDHKAGRALADRLTALVDALAKTIRVPLAPRLSIGVATIATLSGAVTHNALLAEADKSLYDIKQQRHANDPDHAIHARTRSRPAA